MAVTGSQVVAHPEIRTNAIKQEMADFIEVGDEIWDQFDQKWTFVSKVEQVNPVEVRFYVDNGSIAVEGDHVMFRMLRTVEYGS